MENNEEFSKEIHQLEAQNRKIQEEISSIKISASYKLAQDIVDRCKSKKGIITLPFYLISQFVYRKLSKVLNFKGRVPKQFAPSDCIVSPNLNDLDEGVSILIPCYRGESFVERCLNSIAQQSINKDLLEVIFVINGEIDKSPEVIASFQLKHPELTIKIEYIEEANVSVARNKAIECASRQYSIFLDVDDELSLNYTKNALNKAQLNTVVFTNIKDVSAKGMVSVFNDSEEWLNKASSDLSFNDVIPLVSKNASKLIPTHFLKQITYSASLKSGEDVVFMSELFSKFKPQISLCNEFIDTFYIRHMVENSVSRQQRSYDFCVAQRLDVILALDKLMRNEPNRLSKYLLASFINFQLNFIASYILDNRQAYQQLLQDNRISAIHYDIETALNRKI